MYGDPVHKVLGLGHRSSQLMMFSHDVCAVVTLEAATLDTPNKVAFLVTDAPAKCAPTVFEELTSLPFCSNFIRTVTKHILQYIDTGTTQRKKKNSERYSRIILLQRSQHKHFYVYTYIV